MEQINDFAGLSRTNPLLAFVLRCCCSRWRHSAARGLLCEMVRVRAAIKAGLFTLAVVGVLASVVGAFYYLSIIKVMVFRRTGRRTRSDA